MAKRQHYMDVLNVLGAFSVIVLHCTTAVYLNKGAAWPYDVFFQSLCSFAVPVFFMISGANLLGYRARYSTEVFFKRRASRVVITLLAYSALYYVISCVAPYAFNQPVRSFSLIDFAVGVSKNTICDVYWFFYAIIALYIVTPVLSLMVTHKRTLEFSLVISAISTFIIPALNRYAPVDELFANYSVSYLTGNVFYYLLGYYLTSYKKSALSTTGKTMLAAVLAAVLVICMTALSIRTNVVHTQPIGAPYDNFYHSTAGLFVPIYATLVFLLARKVFSLDGASRGAKSALAKVSAYCLDIYAIHMLIINVLDVYVAHSIRWDVFIRPFVVFFISVVFAMLVSAGKDGIHRTLQKDR